VNDILSLYYKSNNDVTNDQELKKWRDELEKVGYRKQSKFPKIQTLDQLVEICTTFIFTGAAHHTVLNWAQWESFAFVPFAPSALYIIPPGYNKTKVDKSQITEKFIMKSLPKFTPTALQIAEMYIITQYSPNADEFLGDYNEFRFGNEKAIELLANFKVDMNEYGKFIEKRGWDHMHPVKRLFSSTSM